MIVLAIHGRTGTLGSNTRQLTQFVLDGAAESGAETEIVDLCDLRITPCTACEGCSFNGICVFDDDMPLLVQRMKEADAIVFASPVYIDNVSGQMKVFFDRLADAIHYQILAGKYGCSVASTHTSGGDAIVAYQNHVLNYLAVVSVGGISVATGGDSFSVDAKEADSRALGKRLCAAVTDGFSDPKQEAEIADNRDFFKDMVVENRDMRTEEYERWVRLGWIR
jgi:multimeric flavodoxin WrbA